MADGAPWIIEKLTKRHDRSTFSCGVVGLDEYLQRYASQNERTGISQHFVAVAAAGDTRVLGYYCLSAGSVNFEHIPDALRKRLGRYPIPVAHLGRLAVEKAAQGRGLGEHLLIDALARIVAASDVIGIHAVEVIATDDNARQFYEKYGFIALTDDVRHLYLPLSAVRKAGLA